MAIDALRTWLTVLIIAGNLILLVVVMTLWLMGGFTTNEFKQTVLMLTPILFAYGTTVFRYALLEGDGQHARWMKGSTSWLAIGALFLLQVGVALLAVLKAYNIISTFEDFTIALGSAQSVLGVYVGLIITELFKTPHQTLKVKKSAPKMNP